MLHICFLIDLYLLLAHTKDKSDTNNIIAALGNMFSEHKRLKYTRSYLFLTYIKMALSCMKSSTADMLPNTWFMMMKKKAPTL